MKTLQVITLGCSKNSVDTSHLLSQVQGLYDILPEDHSGPADIVLLNTCGFIGDAKEQSIQEIFNVVDRKNRGLVGKILVFGCLSQRYIDQLPAMIPEVDGWYGARELGPIVKALGGTPVDENSFGRYMPQRASYAFMKISEGCDRRCSYCAIPLIRGNHRSVPIEKLVAEAEALSGDSPLCQDGLLAVVLLQIVKGVLVVAKLKLAYTSIEVNGLTGVAAIFCNNLLKAKEVAVTLECKLVFSLLENLFCLEGLCLCLFNLGLAYEVVVCQNAESYYEDSAKAAPNDFLVLVEKLLNFVYVLFNLLLLEFFLIFDVFVCHNIC